MKTLWLLFSVMVTSTLTVIVLLFYSAGSVVHNDEEQGKVYMDDNTQAFKQSGKLEAVKHMTDKEPSGQSL